MNGVIVAAWDDRAKDRIFATGRLADGRSFAIAMRAPRPAIYVGGDVAAHAASILARTHAPIVEADAWTSFDGRALARITLGRGYTRDAEQRLGASGVHVHGVDTARATDALAALGIRGPVVVTGEGTRGRRVDTVFVEPELSPATEVVALGWLALDIETDREGHVVAASLAGHGGESEALFVGAAANATCVATERELLVALCERVRARDPDVITGWNVIEFDIQVIAQRCAALGVPFDIGRAPGAVELHERKSGRLAVEVPGRVVLDAMRLVRMSGERSAADDQSLDATAQAVLGGAGKTVSLRGGAKLDELERLRRDEPEAFCAYCMRDSELVLEILRATGLDSLTVRRAALTGVSLDLAWTSIPAFDRVYGAGLRARRIVPPPRLERMVDGAAGGTVLEAEAGVFADVLVFDFRSLYPSLMRTFHIDPLAHERALARGPRADDIVAPNGARFDRGASLLPAILTAYAREREAALAAGDETAAYVYKILQNSFYGVLGAGGCRYARTELAGAITSFGKHFLTLARDWFEARGLHVLYGDTDSVFVRGGHTGAYAERMAFASQLAADLNRHIADEIRNVHDVESFLRIRCDKIYKRFFIARLRGDSSADGRGRGKGYAGLRLDEGDTTEVEVKGMEAVRSDFTPLARRFQTELMRLLFADADLTGLRAYCTDTAAQLVRGDLDRELVYRKVLRRSVEEYDSETPQVRAARLLGWRDRGGPIEYVMTRAGAEPIAARTGAPLDYDHYRDRQLAPIARAVANVLGAEIDGWFNEPGQLGLFAEPRP